MTNPVQFALRPSDKQSDTWRHLRKHLTQRMETLHREIEHDADEAKTAKVRGRIAEVRALLNLDSDSPPL